MISITVIMVCTYHLDDLSHQNQSMKRVVWKSMMKGTSSKPHHDSTQ